MRLPLFKKEDQTGKMFGLWKVIKFSIYDYRNYNHRWECECTGCGVRYDVVSSNMTLGKSKSCVKCAKTKGGKDNPNWKGYKDITGTYYKSLAWGAISRDIEFDISIEYLQEMWELCSETCTLSGIFLQMGKNASVDRIDSSKGYIKDNLQWVDRDINMMKKDLNEVYFKVLCKSVANYNG